MKKLIALSSILLIFVIATSSFACTKKEVNSNPTADTTTPIISGVTVSKIYATTVRIIWDTNEPATSNIEYGLTIAYGSTIPIWSAHTVADKLSHVVIINELSPLTTYHYRVISIDAAGNEAISNDQTLTTPKFDAFEDLTVHYIDVGQGDSIFFDRGETEILIDGGDTSSDVADYLSKYVDGPIEVMVATHPHADHIGGLIAVLNAFPVSEIWLNGDTSTSQTYANFMSAVNTEGAAVHTARRGDRISIGGLVFNVLNPVDTSISTNNNSIVLELSYGQIDFLLEGDAEQEAEASMVAAGIVPDVDILKIGHHGSRTASSASFLAAASPEVAIYMAGTGNTYGHPHAEPITALNAVGATIYGTAVHGTIIVTANGAEYSIQPSNDMPPVTP